MIKIHHRIKILIELNRLFYLVPSSRWQVKLKTQIEDVLFSDEAVIFLHSVWYDAMF